MRGVDQVSPVRLSGHGRKRRSACTFRRRHLPTYEQALLLHSGLGQVKSLVAIPCVLLCKVHRFIILSSVFCSFSLGHRNMHKILQVMYSLLL